MTKTITLLMASMFIAQPALAIKFNKKHFAVAQDIIWAADKVEIPRALLLAVCWGEGSFRTDKNLTHMDGGSLSHGTCQVKLETAQFMDKIYRHKIAATDQRLEDTKINAFYAAKYLKYQLNKYDNNWQLAVDAYNKGSAVSDESEYVKKVEKNQVMVKAVFLAQSDVKN